MSHPRLLQSAAAGVPGAGVPKQCPVSCLREHELEHVNEMQQQPEQQQQQQPQEQLQQLQQLQQL
eukprot:CAMPEP_0168429824 /NCGR_PEP_ID=MMETSP0228-20121227/37568_1 /TAXON_ID=133427 /ORGANISM="Protoceratium reticulatum, Strain CCCM 535 (=CCMP 1889)" /LENGTH=64 /DNA_ID=CAMNT_0008443919 /DNA_START=40 /DNA_END=230 /DNA_ORIENTATION=-